MKKELCHLSSRSEAKGPATLHHEIIFSLGNSKVDPGISALDGTSKSCPIVTIISLCRVAGPFASLRDDNIKDQLLPAQLLVPCSNVFFSAPSVCSERFLLLPKQKVPVTRDSIKLKGD
jgi:hypothetical protein